GSRRREEMRILVAAFFGIASTAAFASAPTVTKVTPAQLGTAGGAITIAGSDFAADAAVKIGGYACADLTVVSATQITCTAPENIARAADVTVTNADGGTATKAGALTYSGVPGFQLLQKRVVQRFGVNAQGAVLVLKCSGCHG